MAPRLQIQAESAAAIDRGDWRAVLHPGAVARGGRSYGRFFDLTGTRAVERLRDYARREEELFEGVLFADLNYLPQSGRDANVAGHPPLLRPHEQPVDLWAVPHDGPRLSGRATVPSHLAGPDRLPFVPGDQVCADPGTRPAVPPRVIRRHRLRRQDPTSSSATSSSRQSVIRVIPPVSRIDDEHPAQPDMLPRTCPCSLRSAPARTACACMPEAG
ncbi:lantibiotic dehydratase [Streptomyces sp. 6N223]|uniref:lantibiotic dehydratase n=1 Tax=Streptomyces sp. 6N223 TaxID=3457412 RepID=UPI003FD50667